MDSRLIAPSAERKNLRLMRPWRSWFCILAAISFLLASACGDVFTPRRSPRYPIPSPIPGPIPASKPQRHSGDKPQPPDPNLPSEQVFKNIQVLHGFTAGNLSDLMESWKKDLGVDCTHCHVADRSSDELKNKVDARQMFRMMDYANSQIGLAVVTCDTCHRGHDKPEPRPAAPDPDPVLEAARKSILLSDEQAEKPAAEVFHNVQILQKVPAKRFPVIMAAFSNALGVKCSFCHNEADYAADGVNKRTARKMMQMVNGAIRQFYPEGTPPIQCWQCHQGQPKPNGIP